MIAKWIGSLTARPWLAAALLGVIFSLGFVFGGARETTVRQDHQEESPLGSKKPERWTCSMHPGIIMPTNDQQCPICSMDLIPLDDSGGEDLGPQDLKLSPDAAALAEVATSTVRREFAVRNVRLTGKVRVDETRQRTITARFPGRLERLFVEATGRTVAPGMELAEIYSPELYAAQTELQTAAVAARAAGREGDRASAARANLKSVQERLRLWGLSENQIREISTGDTVSENLTVRSPVAGVVMDRMADEGDYVTTGSILYAIADLDRVWVVLDAFESDIGLLQTGQPVEFRVRAHPGRIFPGVVKFIEPVLDERTRAVRVRVEAENREALLKPGMLVSGRVAVTLDVEGNPVDNPDDAMPPLVIPATAPLMTGDRAVVYVRHAGGGDQVFTGRTVVLGPRVNDDVVVLSGLTEGEQVVTRGAFKIDSALQILARPSMMNPSPESLKTECPGNGLAQVLEVYHRVQAALVDDDIAAAQQASRELASVLEGVDCSEEDLPSGSVPKWRARSRALASAAEAMIAAGALEQKRSSFRPLSENLWAALEEFGQGDSGTVRLFHCPMAFDNKGGHWIQESETAANPYFGEAMLRCGSVEGVLTSAAAVDGSQGDF